MKKGLLLLVLCLSFAFSFFVVAHENDLDVVDNTSIVLDIHKMTTEELEFYEKSIAQYDAVIFYDKLISSFIDLYGEKDGQPARYPENYAGAYVNDDGKLVIQISSTDDQNIINAQVLHDYSVGVDLNKIKEKDTQFKAESIEDVVVFEQVAHSLNDLNGMLIDSVNSVNKLISVAGYYVDTLNNSVNIILEQDAYEIAVNTIDIYKDIKSDYSKEVPLVFETGEINEPSYHHLGGQGYYYHGSGGGTTLGFTGWYNGTRAYLTCGHTSAFNTGDTARYSNTAIGNVSAKQWAHNGNGDWGIVNLNSGETISGLIKQNHSGTVVGKIKGRVNSVPVNTIVYRFGHKTQVWSTLRVNAVNVSKAWKDTPSDSNYTIRGLVRCTLQIGSASQPGDSGGPFVIANGNDYSAIGTTTGESGGYTYYSPMSHVPTNFAVEIGY
ncbi:chymotrypsin family serine protease [Alkaliphilus peptidifermentans]|uniref:Trypsin n=1 Tax=Alkaliphilus peptidifermentans DSM 18978 TaxID=1120976 RepID=A0A1G5KXD1_9FIRM|nr:hypothetical protein [Alkaliphilus peptidifermentans]SCZ05276.1 hypothetical protein SAMN03080606_03853 [Alkaliphilus peptidifermentans DSM 18978]